MNTKILAAALGLLAAGDDASATVVKTTKTVVAHRTVAPVVNKRVTIVHRAHRPRHLVRLVPAHRFAPRIHVARAFTTKHIAKTTVIR